MVHISHGNSVVKAVRKQDISKIKFKFTTDVDPNKCLEQIKLLISNYSAHLFLVTI